MTKTVLLFLGVGVIVALLIGAGFVFLPEERSMPQLVPQPTSSPAVHPYSDSTAAWKVYKNESLGFSIAYPASFLPVESTAPPGQVGFYKNPQDYAEGVGATFRVSVYLLPKGESLREWIESFGVPGEGIIEVTLGHRRYLKWSDSAGEGFELVSYSSPLLVEGMVIEVTASPVFAGSKQFIDIVSSLTVQ